MRDDITIGDTTIRVGDVELSYGMRPPSGAGDPRLWVFKPRTLIEEYLDIAERIRPQRLFELGIHSGGSTALLALLTEPEQLSAIELDGPVEKLDRFIADRGLSDRIRAHYGVDQADRSAMQRVLDDDFGDALLDLVVDDASHLYPETVASFEVLFPRVRPGGSYVIEDWSGPDQLAAALTASINDPIADGWRERVDRLARQLHDAIAEAGDPEGAALARDAFLAEPTPQRLRELSRRRAVATAAASISRLALDLVLSRAERTGAIDRITISEGWVEVIRGDAELDPRHFRLDDIRVDYFAALTDRG